MNTRRNRRFEGWDHQHPPPSPRRTAACNYRSPATPDSPVSASREPAWKRKGAKLQRRKELLFWSAAFTPLQRSSDQAVNKPQRLPTSNRRSGINAPLRLVAASRLCALELNSVFLFSPHPPNPKRERSPALSAFAPVCPLPRRTSKTLPRLTIHHHAPAKFWSCLRQGFGALGSTDPGGAFRSSGGGDGSATEEFLDPPHQGLGGFVGRRRRLGFDTLRLQ